MLLQNIQEASLIRANYILSQDASENSLNFEKHKFDIVKEFVNSDIVEIILLLIKQSVSIEFIVK